ncbi:MAG: hypothetical protein ACW980_25500 [Promethearchaeota archaeon]|jgi:hypothetical protein
MLQYARKDMRAEVEKQQSLDDLWELFSSYQRVKDAKYDGSWAKRGLASWADGCMSRDIDRFEPLMDKVLAGTGTVADVLDTFDTLLDMHLYSIMGIRLLAVYFPKEFDRFIQEVMEEIGEPA